jgi:hypothetical protein
MRHPTEVIGQTIRYIHPCDNLTSDCSEFDQKDFVTGVQLLTDNYGDILAGDAALNGVTVTNVGLFGL